VNVRGSDGSALLWAIYHADAEMVRAQPQARRSISPNRYGITPLLQASRTGDAAVMDLTRRARIRA
jgi:ankyrin repeat protein